MNRQEALRILGLDDDATMDDVKTAYKETVQILHPDRFASNKKLQERATEQFKNLQEAYEYLTSGKGAKGEGASTQHSSGRSYDAQQLEARLAGIAAARAQLVAQRDALYDSRRNAIMMAVGGALVALLLRRIPFIAALAGTALIWGIVDLMSTGRKINIIELHLKELTAQRKKLEAQLEDLE
ncbi:MAG: DnaJ domain-containing protein [Eggerthellaceae bacterium]|nr:DnaJ domain-containing protein [Eggerthellaceae bacterium]